MRNRIKAAVLVGLVLGAVAIAAETRVNYFNGVPYVFPASQGAAGKVLINDGSGNLSWATAPTVAELWTGAIVFSNTTPCPSGFTRLDTADGRYFRAAATGGGLGGSDSHSHTISGTSADQTVSISGSTAGSGVSITGSTASASIAHTHGTSTTAVTGASGTSSAIISVTVQSGDAPHSHGAGTLSGSAHTHGVGTLAGGAHSHGAGTLSATSSTLTPLYYGVVACVKD